MEGARTEEGGNVQGGSCIVELKQPNTRGSRHVPTNLISRHEFGADGEPRGDGEEKVRPRDGSQAVREAGSHRSPPRWNIL